MSSLRSPLLKPRTLALVGLAILGVCAFNSISRTEEAILLNLLPLFLIVAILAVITLWVVAYIIFWIAAKPAKSTVEDRLNELERLKRRDMVTPEEYEAKR